MYVFTLGSISRAGAQTSEGRPLREEQSAKQADRDDEDRHHRHVPPRRRAVPGSVGVHDAAGREVEGHDQEAELRLEVRCESRPLVPERIWVKIKPACRLDSLKRFKIVSLGKDSTNICFTTSRF